MIEHAVAERFVRALRSLIDIATLSEILYRLKASLIIWHTLIAERTRRVSQWKAGFIKLFSLRTGYIDTISFVLFDVSEYVFIYKTEPLEIHHTPFRHFSKYKCNIWENTLFTVICAIDEQL